jgi:hypothetical protein
VSDKTYSTIFNNAWRRQLKNQKTVLAISVALLVGGASSAFGQVASPIRSVPQKGMYSITPEFSVETSDSGKFVDSASITYSASGVYAGVNVSAAATLSTQAKNFNDVYKDGTSVGASLNYGLNESTEVFGRVRYTEATAKEFDVLNVSAAVTVGAQTLTGAGNFQGKLSDYKSWGGELGVRYFLSTDSAFKPYVAPSIGFAQVDEINLQYMKFRGGDVFSRPLKFYGASNSYTVGLGVGFRYDIAKNVALGVESGIRFQDSLSANNADLGTYKANGSGQRTYIPVTIGLNIGF